MNIGIPEQTHLSHKLFKASASWRRQRRRIHTTQRTPKRTSADTAAACATGARVTVQMTHYIYIMPKAPKICRKHGRNIQTWLQSERTPSKQHCDASRIQASVRLNETMLSSLYMFTDSPPHPATMCVCNGVIFIQYFRDRQTQMREWNLKTPSVRPFSLSLTGHLLLDPYPPSLSLSPSFGSTV